MPKLVTSTNDSTQQIRYLMWLMAAYYFLQGMGGNSGLHSQALDKYLVDNLGLTATNKALFQFIIIFPFMIKPVWGIFTDFLPIFGYRRKSYFIVSGIISTVVCLLIWILPVAPSFTTLAILFAFFMTALAIADVVTDGVMVENGNPLNAADKLQAAQWATIAVAGIIVATFKGYIAQYIPLQNAMLFTVGFPILTIVVTLLFLKEQRVTNIATMQANAWVGLKQALSSKMLWSCAIFLLLWNISPNLGSVFYIYEKKVLLFSDVLIGQIDTVGRVARLLGFVLFIPYFSKIERITLFKILIVMGLISTLSFLLLKDAVSASIIIAISGFISAITQIALLSLAATACPQNAEAFVFAALMSIANFGDTGGGIIGAMLYDTVGYDKLIYIDAFTTLAIWLFLPLIRKE